MPTLKYWDGAAWQALVGGVPAIGYYAAGALPIVGAEGEIAVVELVAGGSNVALCRYSSVGTPGWLTIGRGRGLLASTNPASLTAATGWRKPTTTNSMTFPYAGSWDVHWTGEVLPGAADVSLGIGWALSSVAAATAPTFMALGSGYAANARVNLHIKTAITIAAANEVWDMRGNTTASTTLTFGGGRLWAEPVRITGVV